MRIGRSVLGLASVVVTAGALCAGPASAATTLAPQVQQAALAAMAGDGLGPATATHRLAVQRANGDRGAALATRLGDRAAGSYLDREGNAVVAVLDQAGADSVRAAGLSPKLVRHSAAELAAARRTLDGLPAAPNTASWTDPVANQVVVAISDATPKAAADRLAATAASLGDRVRVEREHGESTPYVLGGDAITHDGVRCSNGFNAFESGLFVMITAGHCTKDYPYWDAIGPTRDSQWPSEDYGEISADYTDHPQAVNTFNGSAQPIRSAAGAYVGENVCKSGSTSQLTCGTVQATDQTITLGGNVTLYGMIRTTSYCRPGDSGGPLFDGTVGLGMVTTGNAERGTCVFQPLPPALATYGASLTY